MMFFWEEKNRVITLLSLYGHVVPCQCEMSLANFQLIDPISPSSVLFNVYFLYLECEPITHLSYVLDVGLFCQVLFN